MESSFFIKNSLFEGMFDIIPFGVYVVDIQTDEIVFTNKKMKSKLANRTGKKCWETVYGKSKKCGFCKQRDLVDENGKPNGEIKVHEIFDEEEEKWYQLQEKAMTWPGGEVVKYSIAVDISEQKSMQSSLAEAHAKLALKNRDLQKQVEEEVAKRMENERMFYQQSKLAAMGEMIGNIAHQWRQPLAQLNSIFLNLDRKFELNELDRDYMELRIDEAEELTEYMSSTINDFQNFFVPGRTKELFRIKDQVKNAQKLLTSVLEYYKIECTLNVESDGYMTGYPGEYMQVVMSIITNAKDILVLRKSAEPKIDITLKEKDGKTVLIVQDNGGGIEEDVLPRIFDPYFTTKHQSRGTGLGLYMSKLIIENSMKGSVEANNSENGAVFTITVQERTR